MDPGGSENDTNKNSNNPEEVFVLDSDDDVVENDSVIPSDSLNNGRTDFHLSNEMPVDVNNIINRPSTSGNNLRKCIAINCIDEKDDVICQLMEKQFSKMFLAEQIKIVKNGRPTPAVNLELLGLRKNGRVNPFYKYKNWLTVSEARGKIYCWTCLLFPIRPNVFNIEGFDDVKMFKEMVEDHSKSKFHISSCIRYNRFKNQFFPSRINNVFMGNDEISIVRRELFKRLLDAWCMCIMRRVKSFEDCLEFFDFAFQHDCELKLQWNKFERAKMIDLTKGLSASIRAIMLKRISFEINKATVFSVIIDHHPKGLVSFIIRYVNKEGEALERLLGLFKLTDKTPDSIFRHLDSILRVLFYRSNMVAHCFSGACFNVDQIAEMNDRIKKVSPDSIFVNCSYHQLCETIACGCSSFAETRVLYSATKSFPRFIVQVMKKIANDNLSISLNEDCDMKKTIAFILENRNALIKFFEDLEGLDCDTMSFSYFFLALLKDVNALCLLVSYNLIFSCFESIDLSEEYVQHSANCNSVNDIEKLKNMYKEALAGLNTFKTKNGLVAFCNALSRFDIQPDEGHIKLFNDLVDNAIFHFEVRFESVSVLKMFELVQCHRFKNHCTNFPSEAFRTLKTAFKNRPLFDYARLQNELEVVYNDAAFKCGSPDDITKAIVNSDLQDVLPETNKLLQVLRTFPPTYGIVSPDNASPSVIQRRTSEYVKSELSEELDVIYVNKEMISQMKKSFNWYDDVMQHFDNSAYKTRLQF